MGEGIKTRRGESQGVINTYLYNLGNEYTVLTGGLEAASYIYYKYPTYYSVVQPVKNVDSVSLVIPSEQYQDAAITTVNKIDVTAYANVKVEYTSSDLPEFIQIVLFNLKNTSAVIAADVISTSATGSHIVLTCDITSVAGEYYISVVGRTGGTINAGTIVVHKVWLE